MENKTHNEEIHKTNNQILADEQAAKGYQSSEWNTWAQWKAQGRMVSHGQKGTRIYAYLKDPEVDSEGKLMKSVVGKSYCVFNREQTEADNESL